MCDVEVAIKVTRSAGYYEQSLFLAKTMGEHDWYLKILVEDLNRYDEALSYISDLGFSEAEKVVRAYGKTLVTNKPEETTALLMRMTTVGKNALAK